MTCVVLASGDLKLDNELFTSPSGAGHAVRHRATNGWTFWRMPDGRRLKDVRTTFRSAPEAECSEVEWTALHVVMRRRGSSMPASILTNEGLWHHNLAARPGR